MRWTSSNKEAVLGVTGSIAAYKACEIASRLTEWGVRVTPVLTKSAQEFVGAATFEAITGQSAIVDMFAPLQNPDVEHIAAATRASLFLIAPATANVIAKAAHGIADDWLSTTLLATRAPILFAPAMNSNMYEHPATRANIETLRERGCHFVGPGMGRLACGTVGVGRMIDPQTVLEASLPLLSGDTSLAGKRVLITSGGNREPIDPVRYIGNRSSGKMGRALALEALMRGARVIVVQGPSDVPMPYGVELVSVETAQEMADAVLSRAPESDAIIGAAAVADYRVTNAEPAKIKRNGQALSLTLAENPDILAEAGKIKHPGQLIVGFAAETDSLLENAAAKLERKKLDLIIANQVGSPDSGFGTDTVTAAFIAADGTIEELGLLSKEELATRIMERVASSL